MWQKKSTNIPKQSTKIHILTTFWKDKRVFKRVFNSVPAVCCTQMMYMLMMLVTMLSWLLKYCKCFWYNNNFHVNFTFLLSSWVVTALLEHNNQCCDNITHPYHLPKSVLTTKLLAKFPKFPNIPENSQYSHKIPKIPGGNLPLSEFPGILHP